MEFYSILYKGKWYSIGDVIWRFPFKRWKIIGIHDDSTALIERKDKLEVIKGKVRITWF